MTTGADPVMMVRFVDGDGAARDVRDLDDDERARWHYAANRRRNQLASYCPSCQWPTHIVISGRVYLAHDPGGPDCERVDWARAQAARRPGMTPEHIDATTEIALAVRSLTAWEATPEKTLIIPDTNRVVRPDVYAWHRTPRTDRHRPVIHEVQLSPQGFDLTVTRTADRDAAGDGARTIWWSPHQATIGRLAGVVIDDHATHVTARAYSELEPVRIAMTPTIAAAAKGLIRDRHPWGLLDWRDDDTGEPCTILVPMSIGSTVRAPTSRLRPARHRGDDNGDERGCERPPVDRRLLEVADWQWRLEARAEKHIDPKRTDLVPTYTAEDLARLTTLEADHRAGTRYCAVITCGRPALDGRAGCTIHAAPSPTPTIASPTPAPYWLVRRGKNLVRVLGPFPPWPDELEP